KTLARTRLWVRRRKTPTRSWHSRIGASSASIYRFVCFAKDSVMAIHDSHFIHPDHRAGATVFKSRTLPAGAHPIFRTIMVVPFLGQSSSPRGDPRRRFTWLFRTRSWGTAIYR